MKMPPHEFDSLLARSVDGTADTEATTRLTAELETNAEARELLRGMAEQAFAVAEAGRCAEARKTKPGGGFGGNFEFIQLTCPRSGEDEWRELRGPLSELRSISPQDATTAEDLIADFIILTSFGNSADLEVSELSIVPIP